MTKWYFNQVPVGSKIREPVNSEFFATDAISNPGEALVREGIQNSLDAAHEEKVMVRIYLSGNKHALTHEKIAPYMDGIWDQLSAERNGLRDVPEQKEDCPFIVFEDFGTTGLTGDPAQPYPPQDGEQNPFFYFFRAEGRSGKSENDRGRWGIGKQVFPRASRISTVFGLTVRTDDRQRMLMGQTVLKSHWANGGFYQDGWFGEKSGDGEIIVPTTNRELLDAFCGIFDLQRGLSDPGLSLVVPWYDSEIDEKWILKAVLRDYFYPILMGELDVIVETPSIKTSLDSKSLRAEIMRLEDIGKEMGPILDLAQWAQDVSSNQIVTLSRPATDRALRWGADLFSDDLTKTLQIAFTKGDRLALHIPVTVRPKDGTARESFFRVYLVRDDGNEEGHPVFIRESIIISDVRSPRTRGVRSLVVIEDSPLATMLGDSENPAHTQWQKDGSNFKGKYIYGPSFIEFVTHSIHEIVQHLTESENEEDRRLLVDVFSLPAPPDEDAVRSKKQHEVPNHGLGPPLEPPILQPSLRNVRVSKITGGFSVTRGGPESQPPAYLDIIVAYDIRRGNAFRKYNKADFDVEQSPVAIKVSGADLLSKAGNRITVAIRDSDFNLSVTGFDERRDLRIRAVGRSEGGSDAD